MNRTPVTAFWAYPIIDLITMTLQSDLPKSIKFHQGQRKESHQDANLECPLYDRSPF